MEEDITDVIITHAHFDHMGGIRFFPNATFHIRERELSQWIQFMSLPRKQGRLVSLSGDHEDLFPGIDVMLAGDLVYRDENLTGGDVNDPCYLPIGLATGS